MANGLLYSTNTFLKYHINVRYRGDIHYVWCSDDFDSSKVSAYQSRSQVPPTSNPLDIYTDLKKAVVNGDAHNSKISEQKASLIRLAIKWESTGHITAPDKDDIIFIVDHARFSDWRPLLYVIPHAQVAGRLQLVPASKRAGLGDEYIIPDLKGSEFDIIEF